MNSVNINNESFKMSDTYKNFMNYNTGIGYLKVRASAAGGAIPISGLKVEVSTIIDNLKVIFFEGLTNDSGVTEKISLPTPGVTNNMEVPETITYEITTTYVPENLKVVYKVNMYPGICVIQNINIVPEAKRTFYGY